MVIIQNNQLSLYKSSLKVIKTQNFDKNQTCQNSIINTNSNKNRLAFKGKTINGNFYTDQEYVDAMKYKDKRNFGSELLQAISDRYGFFEYLFTNRPEKHVDEVKKCVVDIKAEEAREAERARKLKEEEKKLREELERLNAKPLARERAIKELSIIKTGKGLDNCNLSNENLEILMKKFVEPFAVDKINKEEGLPTEIPNGLLFCNSGSDKSTKTVSALAEQVLQNKFPENFKEVSIKNDDYLKFIDELKNIKENASTKYHETGERTIILMKDFDEIAYDNDHTQYNSPLNSFLKTYFLNCAESGCTILATAKNPDNIEDPFIVNKKRFSDVIYTD